MLELKQLIEHDIQLKEVILLSSESLLNEGSEIAQLGIRVKSWGEVKSLKEGYAYLNIILGDKETAPVYLNIVQKGYCESKQEIDIDKYKRFLEIQGVRLMWSFARQTIYDLTSKMGIDPYLLPTLDVLKTLQQNRGNEDGES